MILEGRVAALSFALCFSSNVLLGVLWQLGVDFPLPILPIINLILVVVLLVIYRQKHEVALRAALLGAFCGSSLLLACSTYSYFRAFGIYVFFFTFFHWSEYISVAATNADALKLDSFLLNHSFEYWIAATASWLEYIIELYFIPDMKLAGTVCILGVFLCTFGEAMRKIAIFTARANFTHLISYRKRGAHRLVTHGVYAFVRHPSYVGWFWWSVGTQLVLQNPLCTVCYAIVSWRFFNARVFDEEITLLNFFGDEYVAYQRRVPTGIPFIRGFRGEDFSRS